MKFYDLPFHCRTPYGVAICISLVLGLKTMISKLQLETGLINVSIPVVCRVDDLDPLHHRHVTSRRL